MSQPPGTLGIVAGGGDLPVRVAEAAQRAGRPVYVAVIEGSGDVASFAHLPHGVWRWGQGAGLLRHLREIGVRELVLAGRVRRPTLRSVRPEAGTVGLVARFGRAVFGGDDAIIGAAIRILREEGFEIVGAQQILTDLLPKPALLAGAMPDEAAQTDIRRGVEVCHGLGAVDVGQACVVQQGLVLAVEAIEGTDAMIARAGALRREGPGGVLVKCVKPGQSRLADLPTIGVATVQGAAAAGLRGLAIEANGTIVMDRPGTIAAAEAAGLFILAFDTDTILRDTQP